MRRARVLLGAVVAAATLGIAAPGERGTGQPPLLLRGTGVTMDDAHQVIPDANVLVRDGKIVAVWSEAPPPGVSTDGARTVSAGNRGLIFPALIDVHNHPSYDMLPLWPPPSSNAQPSVGRPTGREPYDNRYEWNLTSPPEYLRLVRNAHAALTDVSALDLGRDVIVHAEVQAALGGESALEGESTGVLIRAVEGENFGRSRIEAWVPTIGNLPDAPDLAQRMAAGTIDAWIVHLAEGVRDEDRERGDRFSSRHEFDVLRSLGLLTRATVIIHGTALERSDFAAMHDARAKLVWSPTSNLLVCGRTTNVYDALAAGVTVALGTDWTPSGSPTLLDELKVADIALRDPRVLGRARGEVPTLAGDVAIDRLLVDMVTRNAAAALRWPEVGSIEPGKHADLLVLRRPARTPTGGMPDSPYRNLIDATQRDVRLLLVDGKPVTGDPDAMRAAGADALQLVHSKVGRFAKAISAPGVRIAAVESTLATALRSLSGNDTYLRTHWAGGRDRSMSNAQFRNSVLAPLFGRVRSKINRERIALSPLFTVDDHFFFTMVGGRKKKGGRPDDPAPPFRLYRANFNQIGPAGDPFAPRRFYLRWYRPSSGRARAASARCAGSCRSASSAGPGRTRPVAGTHTPRAARARMP
jgi:5-methylthioadenosine/S-adenosylhomocysteine deaminase